MKSGEKIVSLMLVALFAVFIVFSAKTVFANTFNVTVEVNIGTLTEITVTPQILNWSGLLPGFTGGNMTVDVRNTGSTNITNMYAFVTTLDNESARPYTSSDPQSYSAGGLLTFKNESTPQYFWAGRLEWNWTESIQNTNKAVIGSTSRAAEGFFRNASRSFYWAVGNGTNGGENGCNNTGAIFAIEDQWDNGTSTTRTPDDTSITRNGGDFGFSYFSVGRAGSFLVTQCVAVSTDCTKVYVYNFDKRSGGSFNGTTCSNADFITAGPLAPNDIERLSADAWVPKGIPAGTLKAATWTFVVTGV